jgi:hypothetical protein
MLHGRTSRLSSRDGSEASTQLCRRACVAGGDLPTSLVDDIGTQDRHHICSGAACLIAEGVGKRMHRGNPNY